MSEATRVTGGCLCGAIRFVYEGAIGDAVYCHCEDCRRATGSAFAVGVRLAAESFSIERGAARTFAKHGSSGGEVARHFCGDCGALLFTRSARHPERVVVMAGSLDDPGVVKPALQIWTASAVSWHAIDPALPAHVRGVVPRASEAKDRARRPRARVSILGVSGSLQAKSANKALLESARRVAPSNVAFTIFDGLRDLPHFDPDLDPAPEAVARWRAAIAAHDALLVACPEYGMSLPGALKNAIDWVIGSGELEGKIVGATAASAGGGRGKMGLQALRQTLGAVSARVIGGGPIAKGGGLDGEVRALVEAIVAEIEHDDRGAPPLR